MIDREDPAHADFDLCIHTQFTRAAETYASQVDVEARLNAVLAAGPGNEQGGTAVVDS